MANLEKEIQIIKRNQDHDADRLLQLYDELPVANAAWEVVKGKLKAQQDAMALKRQGAEGTRKELEAAFQRLGTQRPEVAKSIPPNLLAKYEAIRKNHSGIGMVEVEKKTTTCGGCGTHLPERSIQQLKEDKTVVCEACHRLLYYTEGAV